MNNKRGGVGAKILIVLILMLASAGGGAYGYSYLDGKLAVREAKKIVESVKVSDYDTPEATEVQSYIDGATKDLDTASSRKDVYEVMEEFKTEISKVKTKTQKELEAARKEAEEARNNNDNNKTAMASTANPQPTRATSSPNALLLNSLIPSSQFLTSVAGQFAISDGIEPTQPPSQENGVLAGGNALQEILALVPQGSEQRFLVQTVELRQGLRTDDTVIFQTV